MTVPHGLKGEPELELRLVLWPTGSDNIHVNFSFHQTVPAQGFLGIVFHMGIWILYHSLCRDHCHSRPIWSYHLVPPFGAYNRPYLTNLRRAS